MGLLLARAMKATRPDFGNGCVEVSASFTFCTVMEEKSTGILNEHQPSARYPFTVSETQTNEKWRI